MLELDDGAASSGSVAGPLGRLLLGGSLVAARRLVRLVSVQDVKVGSVAAAVAARLGALVAYGSRFVALLRRRDPHPVNSTCSLRQHVQQAHLYPAGTTGQTAHRGLSAVHHGDVVVVVVDRWVRSGEVRPGLKRAGTNRRSCFVGKGTLWCLLCVWMQAGSVVGWKGSQQHRIQNGTKYTDTHRNYGLFVVNKNRRGGREMDR